MDAEALRAKLAEVEAERDALRAHVAEVESERDEALASLVEASEKLAEAREIEEEYDNLWEWHNKLKQTRAAVFKALHFREPDDPRCEHDRVRLALKLSEDPDDPDDVEEGRPAVQWSKEAEDWLEERLRQKKDGAYLKDKAGNFIYKQARRGETWKQIVEALDAAEHKPLNPSSHNYTAFTDKAARNKAFEMGCYVKGAPAGRSGRKGHDWDAEVLKAVKAAAISGAKKSADALRDELLRKYPDATIPARHTVLYKIKQLKEEALKEEAQAKALADAAAKGAEEHKPEPET